jgi:hypothetical protein
METHSFLCGTKWTFLIMNINSSLQMALPWLRQLIPAAQRAGPSSGPRSMHVKIVAVKVETTGVSLSSTAVFPCQHLATILIFMLTFRHQASYLQDRCTATLQRMLFIYLVLFVFCARWDLSLWLLTNYIILNAADLWGPVEMAAYVWHMVDMSRSTP